MKVKQTSLHDCYVVSWIKKTHFLYTAQVGDKFTFYVLHMYKNAVIKSVATQATGSISAPPPPPGWDASPLQGYFQH